jgi:hypothetical protein
MRLKNTGCYFSVFFAIIINLYILQYVGFKIIALQMKFENEWVEELVGKWVERSVGSQESYVYFIREYLSATFPDCKYSELVQLLNQTKEVSQRVLLQYPEDAPLKLSHAAFCSAIDQVINTPDFSEKSNNLS